MAINTIGTTGDNIDKNDAASSANFVFKVVGF